MNQSLGKKFASAVNNGDFISITSNSGYLYVSIVYNISIFMALYCLAMFWMCVSEDLKPFRCVVRPVDLNARR